MDARTIPQIAVITCAVLEDEIRALAASIPQVIRIDLLPQGLHNDPPELRNKLQEAVELVEQDARVDAIVLGYGLCSRGIEGVRTQRCKFVVARAHDCITLLLGCKDRYAKYVAENPGTYWYSPGWNRHHIPPGKERYEKLRAQYVEKYGEDNADFLMESEQHWFKTYNRATYVDLNVGPIEKDVEYTKQCANWLNWSFDHQRGDQGLLRDLLSGNWDDERFLVLQPNQTATMTADHRIIQCSKV
jgi:hypothetical protein